MKIVVIGGSGLIGSKLVTGLRGRGHAVADVTVGPPLNGMIEVAGPQQFHLDDWIRDALRQRHDPREVIADPHAPYFETELGERVLVPAAGARLAETSFDDWLNQAAVGNHR